MLTCLAHALHAQSIIYSPAAAFSPDLVVMDGTTDIVHLLDHAGLVTDFSSGVTPWDAYGDPGLCATLHGPQASYQEFWGLAPVNVAHLVLDMGFEGTWDRMAIYNEEAAGFGNDPVTLSHGPSTTGPWTDICQLALTDHPDGYYGPDVAAFDAPITARYFRITGSGSLYTQQGQYFYTVAEIFLGSADDVPPTGTCMRTCATTSVPSVSAHGFTISVDAASGSVSINGLRGVQSIACYDMLGQLMAARSGPGDLDISNRANGTYAVHVRCIDGLRAAVFVKAMGP